MEEIGNAAYCALDIKVCHLSCQTLPCLGLDRCEVSGECAPVACDKDPGVVCPANHRCDPKRAAQITYSSEFGRNGCVPLPCEDTGHCADDATHICDPSTAMDQRYAGNRDYHGCRKRRCDENVACPADYICVPAAADTDPFGCVLQGTCRAP